MTPYGERGLSLAAASDNHENIILALMIDASKTLPKKTRYELRGDFNHPPGDPDTMCWYSNKEMQELPEWDDFLNKALEYIWVEDGGYFLIGRQTT